MGALVKQFMSDHSEFSEQRSQNAGSTTPEMKLNYQKLVRQRTLICVLLACLIVLTTVLDVYLGSSDMALQDLLSGLFMSEEVGAGHMQFIVWQIRIPQALLAVVIGLCLGLAGAEMQTVLNNPLASPFTLGISTAAAFGAALALILQVSIVGIPGHWIVSVNAFIFAMGSALLLDVVARWSGMKTSGIVLFGIALFFSFNALVSLLQYVASAEALQSLVFWTMGSLTQSTDDIWMRLGILFAAFTLILPWSLANAWRLTALRLGEDRASSFGVNVKRVRLGSLLRISILSALAVAFVGTIGFIGLVSPHIARRLLGEDHRFYLPASALVGAVILSAASIVSKNMVSGTIVPIGIITALVGVPFFMAIVLGRRDLA